MRKSVFLPTAISILIIATLAPSSLAAGETTTDGTVCTIVGTPGVDKLIGTTGDDVICGLGGDDVITAGAGNDTIDGGDGDDVITAGAGNDTIDGDDGDDVVNAGAGDDVVDGGADDDFIELGSGDDYSLGGPGADKLFGGDGRDALLGGNDNDSMVGGSGVDDLDGEAGVNYCDSGTGDTTNNCFFDQGGPKLVSVAVLNPTIDTSKSDQFFVLRARVDDLGTGVSGFGIQFDPYNFDGGHPLSFAGGDFSTESCNGSSAANPNPKNNTRSSYCLVSGDRFSGIYEVKVRVPKYTPKMTWKVLGFSGQDFAGNQSDYNADDVKAKGLALTIKQKGKGDSFKPTLGAVVVMTKSINTQKSNAIVNFRVAYKDKGIGIRHIEGSFVLGNDFEKRINFYYYYDSMNSCVNGVAPDPTMPGSESSCLIAGNELGGVIDYKIMMPKFSPKGTYQLHGMIIFDEGGNNSWYGGTKLAKNQKASIRQVGKGDESAPTITSIKVLTPKVSTRSGSTQVRIQVKAKDSLAGVSRLDVGLSRTKGKTTSSIHFGFSANEQSCGLDGHVAPSTNSGYGTEVGCLVSGTLNDGVFEMIAVIPAHFAKGQFSFSGIYTSDKAGNERGNTALQVPKLKAVITNG